ncbi:MAG: glycosyltransferase family 2 protein [Bacteroidia bacterium]|nr:glycosyltransferase family 2 protein [Bacteroidia bacterium]
MEQTAQNSYPTVDIVVLNYNGKRFLDACFQSLRQTNYPAFKVYLLDNASTDDDVSYVQQHFPEVEILRIKVNRGFCAAYNYAFKHCTGKYFVCLNNDVMVKPDWIKHLVNEAESDERIASLQPKMVSYLDESKFEYAGASGGMIDIYGYPFARGRLFYKLEDDKGQYDDTTSIFWACGAAMFIRKSVLDELGDFDETIVHHMDEIDLNWRMHMQGYTSKVVPQSVILHYGGATIAPASYKKTYWNHRNSIYLMLKNFETHNALTKVPLHIIFDYVTALRGLFMLNFKTVRAIFNAHLWLTIHWGTIRKNRRISQSKRQVNDKEILKKMYPRSVVLQYFFFRRKTYQQLP